MKVIEKLYHEWAGSYPMEGCPFFTGAEEDAFYAGFQKAKALALQVYEDCGKSNDFAMIGEQEV